jgi:sugar phosphate isomerase/epimerase
MLQLMSSAVGASLLAPVARAALAKPRWRTAIGLNGFMSGEAEYKKSYPLDEILAFAQRKGFEGVELVRGWPEGDYPRAQETDRIRDLQRRYEKYELQVFSIQLGVAAAFDPNAEVRRRWVETFRDRASFAKQVGCDCIGMWPGGPLRGQSIEQAIERLAESFRLAAKIAGDMGLLAAFEIEPPFVFNTEQHLIQILQKVDSPHLKTIFDPSHFDLMSGSQGRPHAMLQRIGVQNIGYVHLTDCDGTIYRGTSRHLPCGDGHVDIDAALRVLREGGFEGWIMIDPWKIPDPYDACVKGKQAIERAR